MKHSRIASIVIAAGLFVGCNQSDDSTKTPAPSSPAPSTPAPSTPAPSTPAPSSAAPSANTTSDATAAVQTKAKELLDQGMTYVKENKLELAEKTLNQLDEIKPQLPADWAPRIDQLRSAVNAAKASGGKMPALPGGK